MDFAAGQRWIYRAPAGFEASRIVIGALVGCGDRDMVVCAAVAGAPRRMPDGAAVQAVMIPFLPFACAAFSATVVAPDGVDMAPPAFYRELELWAADPRGLSTFTVPFDGYVDKLIARQMADIVGPQSIAP